jgi:hypothetical protein
VLDGHATLGELDSSAYSLDDLVLANEAADARAEAEAAYYRSKAKK